MKKFFMLLVIQLSVIGYSQNNPQWIIYNTTNSILPSNSIREIVIDDQNRKWVSIWGYGIIEIDGSSWTLFDTTNSDIPSNILNTINVDNVGNFWVGGWLDYFNCPWVFSGLVFWLILYPILLFRAFLLQRLSLLLSVS